MLGLQVKLQAQGFPYVTECCALFTLCAVASLQIARELSDARSEVDSIKAAARKAQEELDEERRSRQAAEKVVSDLRTKLDSVTQTAAGAAAIEASSELTSSPADSVVESLRVSAAAKSDSNGNGDSSNGASSKKKVPQSARAGSSKGFGN